MCSLLSCLCAGALCPVILPFDFILVGRVDYLQKSLILFLQSLNSPFDFHIGLYKFAENNSGYVKVLVNSQMAHVTLMLL